MKNLRLLSLLLMAALLPGCAALVRTTPTTPLAADDCGPKPRHAGASIAAWANDHFRFLGSTPFTPEEFTFTEPVKVSLKMPLLLPLGRKVGWLVLLGPENHRLTLATELPYTEMVLYHDQVIFTGSSSFPF